MANYAEVTGTMEDENPYGDSNMVLLTVDSTHDLSLDNVYYAKMLSVPVRRCLLP